MSKRQPKPKPLQPHPSLIDFNEHIHTLEAQKEVIDGLMSFLEEQRWKLVLPLVKEKLPEANLDALEEGFYECPTSPTVRCIYDVTDDPSRDSCIFCGCPEERK